MAQTETPPDLGRTGQQCSACGAPLAGDQRYCLNCGARRGGPRLPYEDAMQTPNAAGPPPTVPPGAPPSGTVVAGAGAPGPREVSPFAAVAAVAVLGGILLIGVLLGRGSESDTVAQAPQVVRVGGGGGTTAATEGAGAGSAQTAASTQFTSDWPSGKKGFTVELGTLPKQGTTAAQVDAQKQQLQSQGASDVGALDSDAYASLPPGNYVLYSGVFDSKGEAGKALGKLKADFPDAKVIEVSKSQGSTATPVGETVDSLDPSVTGDAPVTATDEALEELGSKSGGDYSDASEDIPDVIATEGKPPPVDDKPSGGGAAGTVIK